VNRRILPTIYMAPKNIAFSRKIRVIVFTGGGIGTASSKYRAFLLGKYLTESDEKIEWDIVTPSTKDLSALSYRKQLSECVRQAGKLFFGGYHVVFAQRPIYNKFIFALLFLNGVLRFKPLIFDLDDAVFLYSPTKTRLLARFANACIGGSDYICDYFRKYNANVHKIPTLIKFSDYADVGQPDAEVPTIGWLGYGPSYFPELQEFAPALRTLYESGVRFKFLLIGALEAKEKYQELFRFLDADLTIIEYVKAETDKELVPYFAKMDIGIMPLFDDEWNKGKCALKAIQYMASGAAVVVARVGENPEVVEQGESGMLALSTDEWVASLRALIDDRALRQKLGAVGRERVKSHYSYEARMPQVIALIKGLVRN
jgi:glycosyltransferase involved in cell wall biosynthesis